MTDQYDGAGSQPDPFAPPTTPVTPQVPEAPATPTESVQPAAQTPLQTPAQPAFDAATGYAPQPAYAPQPGYPQPEYPQHPGFYPQAGYAPQPVAYANPYGYAPKPATDGMSIAAIATGICGLVGVLPFIGSILGIVFGIIGMKRTRENGTGGRGLALTGIITGVVGLVLLLLVIVFIVIAINAWHWDYTYTWRHMAT